MIHTIMVKYAYCADTIGQKQALKIAFMTHLSLFIFTVISLRMVFAALPF